VSNRHFLRRERAGVESHILEPSTILAGAYPAGQSPALQVADLTARKIPFQITTIPIPYPVNRRGVWRGTVQMNRAGERGTAGYAKSAFKCGSWSVLTAIIKKLGLVYKPKSG
jgi:hypothetical protein